MFDQYEYLSGVVSVRQSGPVEWLDDAVLPLWAKPNEGAWSPISRVIVHEALHFWQFLSSRYMVRLVAAEWRCLLHYEATGEMLPRQSWTTPAEGVPFSLRELVECWARFWDVHIRSPERIIEEEGIEVEGELLYHGYYTDAAYEAVMVQGEDCDLYAAPYRWLLGRCDGDSVLAALLFPLVTNAAFSTLRPTVFFERAMARALDSQSLRRAAAALRGEAINVCWLRLWDDVGREVIAPFAADEDERLHPFVEAGYQAIERGPLKDHPIFGQYVKKADAGNFKLYFRYFKDASFATDRRLLGYSELMNLFAERVPFVAVFGMPGQPFFRRTLGTLVPPPRIQFANYAWNAPRIVDIDISGANDHSAQNGETFAAAYEELLPRTRRFGYALEAVKLGLPPNAFEP